MELDKLLKYSLTNFKTGLLERNFVQSQIDKCLFMKGNMICLVYVDDKILCGPNLDEINQEIIGLGTKGEVHIHSFQLKDEGQVGDFLGIGIEKSFNNDILTRWIEYKSLVFVSL